MKNKIFAYLKYIFVQLNKHKDKQLHFLYIAFFTRVYNLLWPDPTLTIAIITSFILMFIISICKELIDDKITPGKFSYFDILWGLLGWCASTIITVIRIFEYKYIIY